jgi:hypothetical protein
VRERLASLEAEGIGTAYLQLQDLRDLEQVELLASELL